MTRFEAASLLGISERTLRRRVTAGQYTCTKVGEGKFAEVSFSYTDIGLREPTPVPEPAPEPTPTVVTAEPVTAQFTPTPLGPIELKAQADARFAQDYLCGDATDSAGNTVHGSNARFPTKGIQSLLGPIDPMPRERPDTTAHMDPALVGTPGSERVENPVDSDAYQELINPGHAERKAAMYRNAGVRAPAEQLNKQRNDIAAIRAAFSTGQWSR